VATALRCLTIIAAVVLLALFLTPTLHAATPQASAADITLLNAANRDRAGAGLPALQWDPVLAAAAHQHALRMAQMNTLSHQFPGEPPVQDRARQAGARFSLIAENVAEGSSVTGLHTQWMNSPPHRANLLDPELNSVGISVVQSGNLLFAVEDFSAAVPALALDAQEQKVESQLVARGLREVSSTADARKTCELDRGWAGQKPATVLRYETADLTHLPDEIAPKVASGKYHAAAVGACDAGSSSGFSRFRIAILLY
jgi:Cysteine-rich secretory protein family